MTGMQPTRLVASARIIRVWPAAIFRIPILWTLLAYPCVIPQMCTRSRPDKAAGSSRERI